MKRSRRDVGTRLRGYSITGERAERRVLRLWGGVGDLGTPLRGYSITGERAERRVLRLWGGVGDLGTPLRGYSITGERAERGVSRPVSITGRRVVGVGSPRVEGVVLTRERESVSRETTRGDGVFFRILLVR